MRRMTAGFFAVAATCVVVLASLVLEEAPRQLFRPVVFLLIISLFTGFYFRFTSK
jgi:hypothetical protein